jgi:hypothetical protein
MFNDTMFNETYVYDLMFNDLLLNDFMFIFRLRINHLRGNCCFSIISNVEIILLNLRRWNL